MAKLLLTTEEAAEILGFHPATVRRLGLCGEIQRRTFGRMVRFHREDVMRLARRTCVRLDRNSEAAGGGEEAAG